MMAEIERSDAELFYMENCQSLEGEFLEEKDEKALSPKLQDVISIFRRYRSEPFTLQRIVVKEHSTYAFSTKMHDLHHIFVFNDEGKIVCILSRDDVCTNDDGNVEEFFPLYPVNSPEQYWRHLD